MKDTVTILTVGYYQCSRSGCNWVPGSGSRRPKATPPPPPPPPKKMLGNNIQQEAWIRIYRSMDFYTMKGEKSLINQKFLSSPAVFYWLVWSCVYFIVFIITQKFYCFQIKFFFITIYFIPVPIIYFYFLVRDLFIAPCRHAHCIPTFIFYFFPW